MSLDLNVIQYQLAHYQDDRAQEAVVVTMVLAGLATLAVILRLVSRKLVGIRWKADDYLIIVAYLFTLSNCVQIFPGVQHGLGKHVLRAGLANAIIHGKLVMLYELNYSITIVLIKASIVVFYAHIFPGRTFRIALYAVGVYVVAWYLSITFATIFQCTPIRFMWEKTLPGGHCINVTAALTGMAVTNMISDVAILILPMHAVWHLQVPRSQKIAVACIFLLGGFVCIASIVRIFFLSKVATTDPTWTAIDPSIWSSVELCLGVVSACLPTMRPLLRNLFRLRISVGLASTTGTGNSTKMSKLGNSYASGGYAPGSRKGSVAQAAAAGRNGSFAHPAGAAAASKPANLWPGYTETEQEYKAKLDRDLDPVGYQHHARRGSDKEARIATAMVLPPQRAFQTTTGVTSEVTLGTTMDSDRGSDDVEQDDEIRRLRGRHADPKTGAARDRDRDRDLEKGLPRDGIRVEKQMEWSMQER